MNINNNNIKNKLNSIRSYDIRQLSNIDIRGFYERNRQQILTVFLVVCGIFFLFYWTNMFFQSKIESYNSAAKQTYERLEKAVTLAAQIKGNEGRQNSMQTGLLSYLQKTGGELGITPKIANIRSLPSGNNIEHVSLRVESMYYDEFIKFIANVEQYDNLWIKSLSFSRRYNNPMQIDAILEIVKS